MIMTEINIYNDEDDEDVFGQWLYESGVQQEYEAWLDEQYQKALQEQMEREGNSD